MVAAAAFATSACTPEQTPTDQPPEPKAVAAHSQPNDAIQQPIDKAKAVESTVGDAAERQKAAIDSAIN
ncbi:MAG TPA: hypothetical protein VK325_09075 [Pseudoxanthomonas sp.]|nr:hypothetical protein [Pseudoxanthomonas sp.]